MTGSDRRSSRTSTDAWSGMGPEAGAVQASAYLSESRSAVPASVAWAREAVGAFAAAAGIHGEQLAAVRLVVSEAVTNAVKYAYDGSPGEVHVIAAVVPGELWVVIADDGEGMRRASSHSRGLGRGLALMAQLSDGLTILRRSSGGVEARMRFDLASPGEAATRAGP